MIITTIETIPDKVVKMHFGLVCGCTVRAKAFMQQTLSIVNGEATAFTKILEDAENQAIDRMKCKAQELGANAVVNVRLSISSFSAGAAEVCAYGTALFVEDDV